MTAPNRKDRLLSTDAREILNVTNPSIYDAAPRKGGYVNQQPPQMEGATTQTSKTRSKEEDDDDSQKGCPCKSIMEQQSDFVARYCVLSQLQAVAAHFAVLASLMGPSRLLLARVRRWSRSTRGATSRGWTRPLTPPATGSACSLLP